MKPVSYVAALLSSLSFVYPMFNEAENIETAVRESLRIGSRMSEDVEVVVVDDASTDGCGEIADRLSRENPEVRVIHHPENRRLGGALKTGFAAAANRGAAESDGDVLVFLNPDTVVDPGALPRLASTLENPEIGIAMARLRLLDRPEAIAVIYATPEGVPRRFVWRRAVHDIARVEGPERIAPEWWRAPSKARLRDYYRVEDQSGRRFWIYREGLFGDGRGGAEWYLHGLFG